MSTFSDIKELLLSSTENEISTKIDNYGRNIFHWISWKGFYDLLLLDFSFLLNNIICQKDNYQMTPFLCACHQGRLNIIKYFFEKYRYFININEKGQEGLSALHYAAWNNYPEVVIFLLENGASPNLESYKYLIPLHLACIDNHIEVVKILISKTNDVNHRDIFNSTSLHLSAKNGNYELIELLLSHGANINLKDTLKRNALHIAVESKNMEVSIVLIQNKIDINSKDSTEMTPLHICARNGNLELVKLLLDYGAIIDDRDWFNSSALHYAAVNGYNEVVLFLIDNKATIDIHDTDYNTPLHSACSSGHKSVIDILLEKGAQINSTNCRNQNCLHIAAYNDRPEICLFLISRGFDPYKMDEDYNTPITAYGCELDEADEYMAVTAVEWYRPKLSPQRKEQRTKELIDARNAYLLQQLRNENWNRRWPFMQMIVGCSYLPLQNKLNYDLNVIQHMETLEEKLSAYRRFLVFANIDLSRQIAAFL
jgi:ankyrin repeat protein